MSVGTNKHFQSFANSSKVSCQWEKPGLENTLLYVAAFTELLSFCFFLPLVFLSHFLSVCLVPLIVSRCRPCCLFSSVNIKWPCVSVSREPTLIRVCVSMRALLTIQDCFICPNYTDNYSAVTNIHSAFTGLMN